MDKKQLPENIEKAFEKEWLFLLGTSDRNGTPHIAFVDKAKKKKEGMILLEAWFCPKTIKNVLENSRGLLIILEPSSLKGFQLSGNLRIGKQKSILNGYAGSKEIQWAGHTQERININMEWDDVLELTYWPHSDETIRT